MEGKMNRIEAAVRDGIDWKEITPPLDLLELFEYLRLSFKKNVPQEKIDAAEKDLYSRPAFRCNQIINAVNAKEDPSSIRPPLDEFEMIDFKRMQAEKAAVDQFSEEKAARTNTRFTPLIYDNVESEW